jgi:hypothetical protein
MGESIFRIVPAGEEWRLEHKRQSVACMTKEAAFAAAVLAAERAIREDEIVHIVVDPGPDTRGGRDQN